MKVTQHYRNRRYSLRNAMTMYLHFKRVALSVACAPLYKVTGPASFVYVTLTALIENARTQSRQTDNANALAP